MEDESITMAISKRECSVYDDQEYNEKHNICEGDNEETNQLHSLLRLMKISNEFAIIRDSMEVFPLPGNRAEPQYDDTLRFGPQARDFGRGIRATDLLMSLSLFEDITKNNIKEHAENAMDEVTKLFTEGEPLWQHDMDIGIEVLNNAEYVRRFSPNLNTTLDEIIRIISVDAPIDHPRLEPSNGDQATREIGYVQMPALCVVEMLMDVRLWAFVFSEILSRASVLGILSPGSPGTQDGALQTMIAEYHAPSPLLPTRQSCFARYCKQFSDNMWVIVDISMDSMIDNPLMNCKRNPSGCLIQGLPDGNTQITWIEHMGAKTELVHPQFNSSVNSGLKLSAKHWVDTLSRQCQNLNIVIQQSLSGLHREGSPFSSDSLLRLSQRMKREFYGAVSGTKDNQYKPLPFKGGDDILIKTVDGYAQNPALITVTTSCWFPFAPQKVFRFLGDEKNRTKWDILALEHASHEVLHFYSSEGPKDIVSVTKMVDGKGNIDTLFLQEQQENSIASYIVFSPITYDSLVSLSNKGNVDDVPLLPSGFAILPDTNPAQAQQEDSKGCILTLSFQLFDSSSKTQQQVPKKTVRKLYNLVTDTISKIRGALFEPPANPNRDDVETSSW
ncbi:hypothetical protein RND81_04G092000 [Saponaria officinalis]|uniref:START domain-containing protein n=1 Tax=Saponaria officinalis TaxID=3572 RepID=A0AAW1LDC5_SAPOF